MYTDSDSGSTTNPTNNQIPDRKETERKKEDLRSDARAGQSPIYHPTPTPWLSCGSSRGRTVEMPPEKKGYIYVGSVDQLMHYRQSEASSCWEPSFFAACVLLRVPAGRAMHATQRMHERRSGVRAALVRYRRSMHKFKQESDATAGP